MILVQVYTHWLCLSFLSGVERGRTLVSCSSCTHLFSSDLDEALRSAVFWAEQAEKPEASSTGKITLVFVRQGATAANGDLTLARAIAPILANNFPERLDKVLKLCSYFCVLVVYIVRGVLCIIAHPFVHKGVIVFLSIPGVVFTFRYEE